MLNFIRAKGTLSYPKLGMLVLIMAAVSVLVFIPRLVGTYWISVASLVLMYVFLTSAWNIAGGICGQFSFMHPLFMGIGAYSAVLLFNNLGISPWLGMLVGAIICIPVTVMLCWLPYKVNVSHIGFILITAAFVYIGLAVAVSWKVLGGHSGILLHNSPGFAQFQFTTRSTYYYFMLVLAIAVILATWLILRSKLGFYFRAIRDNETTAEMIGIDLNKYRVLAMVISACLTSIGGSFYALLQGYVNAETGISIYVVIQVILFCAIGGMGTLWGPVAGVLLVMPLGELVRIRIPGPANLIVYGAIVILIIMLAPKGLVPTLTGYYKRRVAASKTRLMSQV